MEDVIVVSVFHCPAYHAERHYSTVFWRSALEKKHEEFLCEKPSALNGEQFLSEWKVYYITFPFDWNFISFFRGCEGFIPYTAFVSLNE